MLRPSTEQPSNFSLALLMVGVAVVVYLLPLGVRPLIGPDELRYAAIPAEMHATGDWVTPHLGGFRYFEKPVGGYWLVGGSTAIFGDVPFAQRLPAVLSTFLAAGMVGLFVAVGSRRSRYGWLAAGVHLTTIGCVMLGRTNVLDAPFAGLITVCVVSYFLGVQASGWRRAVLLGVAGAACGGAFMVKGLLAAVVPALAAGAFLVWQRRWRDLFLTPWIPLLVACVVATPWAIAIHRAEPGFWEHFIIGAHFNRFAAADSNQHSEPFWFYALALPLLCVPWLFAWPMAIAGLGRLWNEAWVRFALCWAVAPVLFLSLSSGKLATYVLPVIGAVSALTAVGLVSFYERTPVKAGVARFVPAAFVVVLAVGVGSAPWLGVIDRPLWDDGSQWRIAYLAGVLLIWAGIEALSVWRPRRGSARLAWSIAAPVAFLSALPMVFPTGLMSNLKIPAVALLRHQHLFHTYPVVTDERIGAGVAWVSGDREMRLIGERGDFGSFPDDGGPEAARFIEPSAIEGTCVLALPTERFDRVVGDLQGVRILERYDDDGLTIGLISVD